MPEDARVRFILSFALVVYSASALCAAPSPREAEIYSALLSWAVKLSGYERPAKAPVVEFVPQAFFDAHACGGRSCHVWGWYPNTGKNVVYVHESVRDLIDDASDPKSLLAASIIVHEFTHYLQAARRGFGRYTCEEALGLEREAYNVQNAYLVAYGRYMQVGISMHSAGCAGNTSVRSIP
jgi:hypothetical protein